MPVFRVRKSERYQELLGALTSEIKQSSREEVSKDDLVSMIKPGAPFIVEDPEPTSPRFSVTVLWEDWADLGLQERSGMILDAYKDAKGEQEMLNISRSLGLTAAEAERIGLRFGH